VQVLTGGGSGGSVLLEAGDGGHARVAASGRGEVGPARLAAAGHSRQSDGEIDNDSFDSDALMASADFDLGPSVGVGLVARAHDSEVGVPFSGGAATPRRTNSWRAREIALPFDAVLGDWVLEGRLSRVFHDRELHDPDDPSGFTFAGSESTSRRARMVASHRFDDDLWLAVGGEHEEQEVDSGSVFGTDLDGDSQSTRAAFAQLFWAAGAWRFDLGLRHDDHDAFGARTTPRVGVVRRLGKRSRLRAAYGEGFRAPSIGELYFPFSGNPDLLPEESSSVEVGYQLDGRRWSASLTAFENELENLIDFEFVSFRNVNVGRARTRGVELGAARRWDRADLRLQVTQLDAEDLASGLALLRRPEWRASAVAAWRPEEWTFSATAVHTGERADVDPITFLRRPNPAHQRLDLAVRYEGWPRFAPYARVENATDERYAEALGFDAPGRQWIGGVDLRF
jgi:vitamin B12 transporter